MDIVFLSILGLIVLFIVVVLVRTFAFKPKNEIKPSDEVIEFDGDKAISNLQTLVKFKTISYLEDELEDKKQFEDLIESLPKLFPNVDKVCEFKRFPDRGLLFRWVGKKHDKPAVMMAHFDVVPVNEDLWDKDPFAGIIEDGILWGRGTLDTKVTFNGVLTAADHLISKGFTPENDIYFAFSGQEEISGPGAVHIVDYFKENNITPYMVVDEGGAVVENMFPGVKEPCGLIGIAEKGLVNIVYQTASNGGHASAPKPHTPVGVLSRACERVENHPMKAHITKPVAEMFDTLGRHSNFVYRMIFANLWCFKGVLDMICKKSGGELNALMRTTIAFTQMEGSSAPNVIPPSAKMVSNIRLNPMDTIDSTIDYLNKVIDDDSVKISSFMGDNPSNISETGCEQWNRIASAVASTWKGCIVSPYLMVQASDSRRYSGISNHVYRFSAQDMTPEDRASIHGNNEKIRLEVIKRAVEFYIRLMKQC